MNFKGKALAINSILIVISTSIIGTILHEIAHFLIADYFKLNPQLHHNYVNYLTENATELQSALIAGTGPIFSLVFGISTLLISIKILKPSLSKLFTLWLGMNGILSFLGYLVIAPIAKNGDTGMVFHYFKIPTLVSTTISIIALIVISKIFSNLSTEFSYYKYRASFNIQENTKQLFFYPVWSSIIFITLWSLPVVTWISLLPSIFMPMTYFGIMRKYRKLNIQDAKLRISNVSRPLLILTICVIVVFRALI